MRNMLYSGIKPLAAQETARIAAEMERRKKPRVVLGLSGGVDSCVSALLLKNAGCEVLGVYLKSELFKDESAGARRAAEDIGIDFKTADISAPLFENVCRPFVDEYLRGRTPNPCARCNPLVKFKTLFAEADAVGAEKVTTGHYAKILFVPEQNRYAISPGKPGHDQSYVLYRLPQDYLKRILFPLCDMAKEEVRALAAEKGFGAAEKPDSMEICFIPDGDRAGFIEKYAGEKPRCGRFIGEDGKILGEHGGIHRYTIGQRKHLGISLGSPVYVSKIDAATGDITLSAPGGEYRDHVGISDCVWSLETPDAFEAEIRVRHSKGFARGKVQKGENGTAEVFFPDGIRAPAPGQSLVCYTSLPGVGTVIAGGGIIN
jgi:tRNA-specific 2-thiouridylase